MLMVNRMVHLGLTRSELGQLVSLADKLHFGFCSSSIAVSVTEIRHSELMIFIASGDVPCTYVCIPMFQTHNDFAWSAPAQ